MIKLFRFFLLAFLMLWCTPTAYAQVPQLINFQAQLESFPTTVTPVTFSVYATPSGGTPLWTETHSLSSTDGFIQVLLGSLEPLKEDLFATDGERHLELMINGETLSPRFHLTSVAYALRASTADNIREGAVTTLNELQGKLTLKEGANVAITQNGQEITIASTLSGGGGNSGITTVSAGSGLVVDEPNGPLVVVAVEEDGLDDSHIKDNSLTGNSLANGSIGSDELANNTAVRTINGLTDKITLAAGSNVTLTTEGEIITINAEGGGTGNSGITELVAGNGITIDDTDGPTSTIAIATNSVGSEELENNLELGPSGVLAVSDNNNDVVASMSAEDGGGTVQITQADGDFVAGSLSVRSFNDTSFGGQLQLRGNPNWDAIHLFSDGSTQGGRLVFSEPIPGNKDEAYTTLAIRGENARGQLTVFKDGEGFISLGGDTDEVKSRGSGGFGLSESEYDNNGALPAELYVNGDARITGELNNSITTSTIDHPQDPDNKILNHAGVISSERMTIYSGNVTLDNQGRAIVQLPDWFESLNTNFRYQLTSIGGWARVYIEETIDDNQFTIAGGRQGLDVSWQIIAERNDPYAKENPLEIEENKDASAQGTYIHPNAYGNQ